MSNGTKMSYRMGGLENENVALKADVKRLEAEVARLTAESAGAFVSWLNSRPWTDRGIEDELSDFRAALTGKE